MDKELRILILEDVPADAELMECELRKGGIKFTSKRVETREDFIKGMEDFAPDLILGDYKLPSFDGLSALAITQERYSDVPFIFISGSIGEELAIQAVKRGATDYVLKDRLFRLNPVINRALREIEERTERKQVEEKLSETRQMLINIALGITDGILVINKDFEIVWANEGSVRMTGRKMEELMGNYCHKVTHNSESPCQPPHHICPVRKVINTGDPATITHTHFDKEGNEVFVEVSAYPVKDEKGEIIQFVHLCRDITERKRAEEELQKAHRRISALYTIDHAASQSLNLKEVLGAALDATLRALNIEAGGFYLLESNGETMMLRLHHGVSDEFVKNVKHIKLGEGISGRAAAEKKPVVLDVSEYPSERLAPYVIQEGIQTLASTPLLSGGKLVGAMNLVTRRPHAFPPEELELLVSIGIQLGGVIYNAQLYEMAQQELTERKRAEKALHESEKRFKELFDEAPIGYHELDIEGRITRVNRTELEMLGYTSEEMLGKPVWEFLVDEISPQMFTAKITGTKPLQKSFERTYRRKDGTTFPALMEERLLLDKEGRTIGIRSTQQDITQRKWAEQALPLSEERYRTLVEESFDGIFIQKGSKIIFVNQRLYEMLGYDKGELEGMDHWIVYHPDYQDLTRERAKARMRGEEVPSQYEVKLQRKDGSSFDGELNARVIMFDKEPGIQVWIRDISESKRSEEEKADLQEQLRQSQKIEAIGQLASGIAHDFNNLLTVIQGNAELSLLDIEEKDPLRANIEEIHKAAKKAADLTRQLLAFSRKQILEMRVLDLRQVLQRLEKMLQRIIGEDIELVNFLPESSGKVKADPGQIEQVIVNLAVNARDAMPDGGKLTIETANVELDEEYAQTHVAVKPGRYVMLSMSDTGVGMTPEVKERIFEPFFTTKERSKGTGLGLSTVYGIVKQSGGNIWVYSEPGQGTTLKIYLPQVDEPLEEIKEGVVGEVLQGNETILIVEDEEVVRKLAIRVLKKHGYRVLEASKGDKALVVCEEFKEPIHLIVTDVVMPGMSGRKLADCLKEIHPEMKVLYMSGYTDNAILHHGVLEQGINFIQKPFTVEGLAKKVREVLDK